jgi:hypothetical protein
MSPMMKAPEVTAIGTSPLSFTTTRSFWALITATVGEITYDSTVTHREEPLPIAVSLIGAPGMNSSFHSCCSKARKINTRVIGTDLILVDLVERAMKAANIPTEVQTGRHVYASV